MGAHHHHIHSVRLFNAQAELERARTDLDAWRHTFQVEHEARKRAERERDEALRALEGLTGGDFASYVLRLQRDRDDAVASLESNHHREEAA